MAGLNTLEVRVGSSGLVYVAPVGTTAPTSVYEPMPTGWVDLGALSEDGVERTPGQEIEDIPIWQSRYPARRIETNRTLEIGFTLRQYNAETLKFYEGGGTITTTARTVWAASTAYTLGQFREPTVSNTRVYEVTTAGTTAASQPTWPTTEGGTVTDGSVVWTDRGLGTTAVYRWNPPAEGSIDERAMCIEWVDGVHHFRRIIPRGQVTERSASQLQRASAVDLPVTYSILGAAGAVPYYDLTNSAAFAP